MTVSVSAEDRRAESLALTCFTCHSEPDADTDGIPSIQSLSREELIQRLTEFRNGGGDPTIMDRIAAAYTVEEIAVIAEYISKRMRSE